MDGGLDQEELWLMEEQDIRRARLSFLAFYQRMTGFEPPKHVKLVCKLLQSMEEDKVDRAMVFMPPRAAKTTLCSHLFPAWLIGREPKVKIMSVAHTERYAKKIGGNVRKYLRLPQWPFDDVTVSQESSAKDAFTTPEGGEYNAFGMFGGNQHGNPAEWLFMDDIVKGRKIALSPYMREEAWETYKADLSSRLEGRHKQLLVFTRWHMDDPAGRILPENFDGKTGWYRDRETGERWFVLSIPAVAEHENDALGRKPGEWIWPGRIDERTRGGTRRRGGWIWSALYQQRPSPEEGLMFTQDHIQRYNRADLDLTRLQIYGSSDYAVTKEQAGNPDPDYTVHMVWGVDPEWNIYLLDMWRGRTSTDVWIDAFIDLVKRWKPLRWAEESGQIIKAVGPFLTQRMLEERVAVNRVQLTSSVDKEQRAYSLLGMGSMGRLYLPHRATVREPFLSHLDAFEKELLQFPTGRHDDTVDAATLFARLIDRIVAGKAPKKEAGLPHAPTLEDYWEEHEAAEARKKDW